MHTTAVTLASRRRPAPTAAVVEAARLLDVFLDELRRRRVDGPAVDILVEEAAALRPLVGAVGKPGKPAFPPRLADAEERARWLLDRFVDVHGGLSQRRHLGLEALPDRLAGVVVALRNLLDLPGSLEGAGNVVRGAFPR